MVAGKGAAEHAAGDAGGGIIRTALGHLARKVGVGPIDRAAAKKEARKIAEETAEGARKLPDPPFWRDPNSVRGMHPDDVRAQIPPGYTHEPLQKGGGTRHLDPTQDGRGIYLEDGWPSMAGGDPVHDGPYMKVTGGPNGTTRVPLEGNPTLKPGERGYVPPATP